MIRKQIYLDKKQEQALSRLSGFTGENTSALIRHAIDRFVEEQEKERLRRCESDKEFKEALEGIAGMWANRDDIDFETIRASGNRHFD